MIPRLRTVRVDRWIAVGAGGLAVSVAVYAGFLLRYPGAYVTCPDGSVYYGAATAVAHHSGNLYVSKFGLEHADYLYTPFAAAVLALFSPLSWSVWKAGMAVVNLACVIAVGPAAAKLAGVRGGTTRLGVGLAASAVGLWLEPVQWTCARGQVNLVLLALVMLDLAWAGDRFRGAGIGLAAAIKLTPLVFVPYLWLTGRRRAAYISVLTFAATVAAGFAVLPGASTTYWTGALARGDVDYLWIGNQSLFGALTRMVPDVHLAREMWAVAALSVLVLGTAVAVAACRRGPQLLGLTVCAVTGLLVSPISWTSHWVYVFPAVVLTMPGDRRAGTPRPIRPPRTWARPAFGVSLVALFLARPSGLGSRPVWPLSAPHDTPSAEQSWSGAQLLAGNYYVAAGILFIVAVAVRLRRAEHHAGVAEQPADVAGPRDAFALEPPRHAGGR